jgi:hypothetical protein
MPAVPTVPAVSTVPAQLLAATPVALPVPTTGQPVHHRVIHVRFLSCNLPPAAIVV